MTKSFFIYVIIISLFLLYNYYSLPKQNIYVFSDNNEHHRFTLYLDKYNFNHNELDFLENYGIDILSVYPRNNLKLDLEEIKIKLTEFHYYTEEYLEKKYRDVLKRYSLYDDMEKIDLYGINIDKLVVYSNMENIKNLISDYPKITYEN